MKPLLFLHLFCLGTWLGCVMVEGIIEFVAHRSPESRRGIARIHYLVDWFVEVPSFTTVLVTGLLLLDMSRLTGLFAWKVGLGALAIFINMLCVIPVFRRKWAADRGEDGALLPQSRLIHLAFALGLPPGLISLGIGLRYLGVI